MEDSTQIDSTMDGQPYKAGYHAATLRRMLWREHLGLLPAQGLDASNDPNAQPPDDCPNDVMEGEEYEFVADPMSDKVWDMWTTNATKNTEMYRHLFRADPDDHSKSIGMASWPSGMPWLTPHAVHTFDDYQNFLPKTGVKQGHLYDPYMPGKEVREELDQIKGHLVWMPLNFLDKAEMAEWGMQVNSVTESIYT